MAFKHLCVLFVVVTLAVSCTAIRTEKMYDVDMVDVESFIQEMMQTSEHLLQVDEGAEAPAMTEELVKQQANSNPTTGAAESSEASSESTGEESSSDQSISAEEKKILSGSNAAEQDREMQELIQKQQAFATQAIKRIRLRANRAVARLRLLKQEEETLKQKKNRDQRAQDPIEPLKPTLEQ